MRLLTLSWLVLFTACAPAAPVGVENDDQTSGGGGPAARGTASTPTRPAPSTDAGAPMTKTDVLTFARAKKNGQAHVFAVVDGQGVDLTEAFGEAFSYPLDFVTAHGFDGVAAKLGGPRVPLGDLLPPNVETDRQINAAENYAAHQAETGQVADPYLFPKIALPTGADVTIDRNPGELLDYETELCVAFGKPIATMADLEGNPAGFLLCNDFSERATQVLEIDADNPSTGIGFTDAKSRPGYLPTASFMLVPRDRKAFVESVHLTLKVNGEVRQDDDAKHMIWDVDRLVLESLARGAQKKFLFQGEAIALLPTGRIEKGMMLVSGTPGGVMIAPPSAAFKAAKAAEWVYTGAVFSGISVTDYVKKAWVKELLAEGKFLKPGDVVEAEAGALGRQTIRIGGSAL